MRGIAFSVSLGLALCMAAPLALSAAPTDPPGVLPVAAQSVVSASGEHALRYHLRCWQAGRLLFEETDIELAPNFAPYVVRLRGLDRLQGVVIVAETVNATCLIRGRARGGSGSGSLIRR